jgi:hypothetical protein
VAEASSRGRLCVDCKPGPVPTPGCPGAGEDHSSRRRVATPLERSNPGTASQMARSGGPPSTVPLFKLAPGRACLAAGHPAVARGLLPHDFTLTCAAPGRLALSDSPVERPSAVSFLLRFPSSRLGSALPTSLPYGARTFLPRTMLVRRRSSVHLRRAETTRARADRQRTSTAGCQGSEAARGLTVGSSC